MIANKKANAGMTATVKPVAKPKPNAPRKPMTVKEAMKGVRIIPSTGITPKKAAAGSYVPGELDKEFGR